MQSHLLFIGAAGLPTPCLHLTGIGPLQLFPVPGLQVSQLN